MTVFGINTINNTPEQFMKFGINSLINLFPFSKNLVYNNEIIFNQHPELQKIEGKKVLIVGGGPSTKEVSWNKIDVDYVVSVNNFFKNEEYKDLKVDFFSVGAEVDIEGKLFNDYVNKHKPFLLFEHHGRWQYMKDYFNSFYTNYRNISCYFTRAYGKLGVGIRLLILCSFLKAKEIYFVGLDGCPGLSVKEKQFKEEKHSFEKGKNTLPYQINKENAYKIFYNQYEEFWNYAINFLYLNKTTNLYNLGEDSEYNFSSIWSKKYFPLNEQIIDKIKK